MLVNYMIEKYKEDVISTMNSINNNTEINQLRVLLGLLECNEFIIKCMTDEFDIEKAPEVVYLFDLKRNMFWKQSRYGYTRDIFSAGLFTLEEAKKISEYDYNNNTKIVYFR